MNMFNHDYYLDFTQNYLIKVDKLFNYFYFLIKLVIKLDRKIKNVQNWQIFSFFLTVALLSFNFINVANARVLKKGDQGADVMALQKALQIQGSFSKTEKLTDFYGEKTEQAVKEFQENNGLTIDGIAGEVTQLNLFEKISEDEAEQLLNQTDNNSNQNQSSTQNIGTNNENQSQFSLLKKGSQGQSVINLQKALKAQGYFPTNQNITNYYGNITEQAVRNFQQSQGLPVDGIATSQLQEKLLINNQNQPKNQGQNQTKMILKLGETSEKVKEIQQMLKTTGYFPKTTKITNYYGQITQQAVKNFQQANDLKVDGIVSQQTWDKLVKITSKSDNNSNSEKPIKTEIKTEIKTGNNDNSIDISLKAQADINLCRRVSIPNGGYLVIRLYPDSNSEEVDVLTNGIKVGIKNQGEKGWVPLMEGGFVSSKYLKQC